MGSNRFNDEDLLAIKIIEAIIFSSDKPVSTKLIKKKVPNNVDCDAILDFLQNKYKKSGFKLYKISDTWAFRTAPDVSQYLTVERLVKKRLSRAAQEILSIIAYHQPITRAEIEDIRGVSVSQGSIEILFETGWIEPRGHRNVPGRPSTWRTTKFFLDHFDLESIKDLPDLAELKAAGLLSRNIGPSVLKNKNINKS